MKVLYDHQAFNYLTYGGLARYTYELIRQALKNKTLEVSLFAGIYRPEWEIKQFRKDCSFFYGIKRPDIAIHNKIFGILNRILLTVYCSTSKFDVYHPTLFQHLNPFHKGKFIYTVHDLLGDVYPDYIGKSITAKLIRQVAPKATKILAVSNNTKIDLIERLKIPEEKIVVTYIAGALKREVTEEQIVKGNYILHVGARIGHKNFVRLLSAYNHSEYLKNNFKLVNFGMSITTKEEKEYLEKNKLTDKILFVSGGDILLSNLYKYASVFVFPSLYEGFGIPPLEAMKYGCPIVVSNRSSLPEVVGDAGLYFNPEDEEELIEKLELLLCDSLLRNDLIAKGLIQEKKFSWEKCFKETLAVYNE